MEKNQRIVNSTVKMHEILLGRLSCNFFKKCSASILKEIQITWLVQKKQNQKPVFYEYQVVLTLVLFVGLTKEIGTNVVFYNRLLVMKCLKIQFKIGSFLYCLLCIYTKPVHVLN